MVAEIEARDLDLDNSPVHGTLCLPVEVAATGPPVLVAGGSEGGAQFARYVAAEFARVGVPCLGIAYFGLPGLPSSLHDISLEYIVGAATWLSDQLDPSGARPIVFGTSRGSEAALLTAAFFPEHVGGVVAVVPGNVVLAGWPGGGPAWLLNGEPLPYVDVFGPECSDPAAFIPVEQVAGPLLFVGAGNDDVWPSLAMATAMADRLKASEHRFGHRLLAYPCATHKLGAIAPLDHVAPHTIGHVTPDTAARADAWLQVLAFVRAAAN